MIRVGDRHRRIRHDVARSNFARLVAMDRHRLFVGADHAQNDTFDVQQDVRDVLEYTLDTTKLVRHPVDLDVGDRSTLEAGKQDTAQRVSNRCPKPLLERFDREPPVRVGADGVVANDPARQLQPSPSHTHRMNLQCCCPGHDNVTSRQKKNRTGSLP